MRVRRSVHVEIRAVRVVSTSIVSRMGCRLIKGVVNKRAVSWLGRVLMIRCDLN